MCHHRPKYTRQIVTAIAVGRDYIDRLVAKNPGEIIYIRKVRVGLST